MLYLFDGCAHSSQGEDRGFVRNVLPELFDRASIDAVLQEWAKTIADLPAGLRMAVEMGLVSSLQLARYVSVDSRPTLVRAISRVAPTAVSRSFVGRLMADPAFLVKLVLEQSLTIGSAIAYEASQRGRRLRREWDLAAVNVLSLSIVNALTIWLLAPTRTHGAPSNSRLQSFLQSLPNNAFDREGPLREYGMTKRIGSVAVKATELSVVGASIGLLNSGLQSALVRAKKPAKGSKSSTYIPSLAVPSASNAALSMGVYTGLYSCVRYQLLAGADRWMQNRMNSLTVALSGTAVLRFANNRIGEPVRLRMLGLPIKPPKTRVAAAKRRKRQQQQRARARARARSGATQQQASSKRRYAATESNGGSRAAANERGTKTSISGSADGSRRVTTTESAKPATAAN